MVIVVTVAHVSLAMRGSTCSVHVYIERTPVTVIAYNHAAMILQYAVIVLCGNHH